MLGQVKGSPAVALVVVKGFQVQQIWVYSIVSAKDWTPCSEHAYRVEGFPGYHNTREGAEEAAHDADIAS